jgi:hypothetical protein
LKGARRLERERQRRHRERRDAEAGAGAPMSRAGLTAQVRGAIDEILARLGQEQRMSRDGLGRRLRRLSLGELVPVSAEVET